MANAPAISEMIFPRAPSLEMEISLSGNTSEIHPSVLPLYVYPCGAEHLSYYMGLIDGDGWA